MAIRVAVATAEGRKERPVTSYAAVTGRIMTGRRTIHAEEIHFTYHRRDRAGRHLDRAGRR
jgi:hypothetical protein